VGCFDAVSFLHDETNLTGMVEGRKQEALARGEHPTRCIDFRSSSKRIRFSFPDLIVLR
jgi:hypothetical protein